MEVTVRNVMGLTLVVTVLVLASICPKAGAQGLLPVIMVQNEFDNKYHLAADHRLIVRFKPGTSALSIRELHRRLGAIGRPIVPELGIHEIELPTRVSVNYARFYYETSRATQYAEPDFLRFPTFTPNDEHLSNQWEIQKMETDTAWNVTQGSPSVIVAIVDSGVDINHEDLKDNIWKNPGEIPDNGVDDDSNGFVDDDHGWNFPDNNNKPEDTEDAHGTHVAGSACAVTNNGKGISGVAGKCLIMPVRVLNDEGSGTVSNEVKGIKYAADNGAFVINLSLGGAGLSQAETDAVEHAFVTKGAVVCAAAMNESADMDDNNLYGPVCADGDDNWVLGVAATNASDLIASFSNFSQNYVDVSAPGVGIYSTTLNNTYGYMSGTSMACPITAGLAALIKSANPSATNKQVRDIIIGAVDNIDGINPTYQGKIGSGRINARKALEGFTAPPTGPSPEPEPVPVIPDFIEPNNNLDQARRNAKITVGQAITSVISRVDDPDYFHLPISHVQKVRINVDWTRGNIIGMLVLRHNGGAYFSRPNPDGSRGVTFLAHKGDHYVFVFPRIRKQPWVPLEYTFSVTPAD